jgi:hypothetical protein
MRAEVRYLHKTTGKMMDFCISVFIFVDRGWMGRKRVLN